MSESLREQITRALAQVDFGPAWGTLTPENQTFAAETRHYTARADAVLPLVEVGKAAEPCKKCGYAGGCMEPWVALSLDDPGDKVLIPCGTCPACLGAPGGES